MSLRRKVLTKTQAPIPVVVFAVFTLIGCLFIVSAKLLNLPAWVVTGVPILLMFAYAVMIVVARGLRMRDDQAGDNLYYVGFIFTLTSLAVSLFLYSSGSGVDEIIRNFGIAVGSTIAGVILRIAFNQMRRDPVDIEADTRLELAAAARKVRRELDGVLQELAHFRRTNLQMIEEGQTETAAKLQDLSGQIRAAFDSVVDTARVELKAAGEGGRERLSTGLEALSTEVATATRNMSATALSLDGVGTVLADAVTDLAARLRATQTPDQVMRVELQPMVDHLATAIAAAGSSIASQLAETVAAREAIEAAVLAMRDLSQQMQANLDRTPRRRFLFFPVRRKAW